METIQQVCVNTPDYIIGVVSAIVFAASGLSNYVPAPDKIDNKMLRGLSRLLHFVSADIVTAMAKK